MLPLLQLYAPPAAALPNPAAQPPQPLCARSPEEPRLITTLRPVRKGTNGGVTLAGLAAALGGGLFTGVVYWLATLIRWVVGGNTGMGDVAGVARACM